MERSPTVQPRPKVIQSGGLGPITIKNMESDLLQSTIDFARKKGVKNLEAKLLKYQTTSDPKLAQIFDAFGVDSIDKVIAKVSMPSPPRTKPASKKRTKPSSGEAPPPAKKAARGKTKDELQAEFRALVYQGMEIARKAHKPIPSFPSINARDTVDQRKAKISVVERMIADLQGNAAAVPSKQVEVIEIEEDEPEEVEPEVEAKKEEEEPEEEEPEEEEPEKAEEEDVEMEEAVAPVQREEPEAQPEEPEEPMEAEEAKEEIQVDDAVKQGPPVASPQSAKKDTFTSEALAKTLSHIQVDRPNEKLQMTVDMRERILTCLGLTF